MATSTQTNQKLRKANTISSVKGNSGPIRATVRYRLLLTTPSSCPCDLSALTGHERGSGGVKETSCNSVKDPSKEQRRSFSTSGQSVEVVKSSDRSHRSAIHRSSSFDTIVNYLNGEWPTTEPLLQENGYSIDEVTPAHIIQSSETPDHWQKNGRLNNGKPLETLITVPAVSHRRSSSLGNGDNVREFKARLAKSRKEGSGTPAAPLRASPVAQTTAYMSSANGHLAPPKSKAVRVVSQEKHRGIHRHSRGSLEGINQEIEKMDLDLTRRRERSKDGRSQASGRCAPVKNLLTMPPHSDIYASSTSPGLSVDRSCDLQRSPDVPGDRSCDQRSPHDDDATPTNGYLSPAVAALNSPSLTGADVADGPPQVGSPKISGGGGGTEEEDNGPGQTVQFYSPRKVQRFEGLVDMLDRRSPDGCEKIEMQEQENLSSSKSGSVLKILRPIPTKVTVPSTLRQQHAETIHTSLFMQYVNQPHAGQHHVSAPSTDQQYVSQQCAAQISTGTQQYISQHCAGTQHTSQPTKLIFNCSAFQLVKKHTQ